MPMFLTKKISYMLKRCKYPLFGNLNAFNHFFANTKNIKDYQMKQKYNSISNFQVYMDNIYLCFSLTNHTKSE